MSIIEHREQRFIRAVRAVCAMKDDCHYPKCKCPPTLPNDVRRAIEAWEKLPDERKWKEAMAENEIFKKALQRIARAEGNSIEIARKALYHSSDK